MFRKKSKLVVCIAILVVFAMAMVACAPKAEAPASQEAKTEAPAAPTVEAAPSEDAAPTEEAKPETKTFEVGFAQATVNTPFQDTLQLAAKEKAAELGINLDIQVAMEDNSKQAAQIETFIASKKDAIIVLPCNSDAVVPAIKQANDAGIPVISVNRPVGEGATTVSYVGADDEAGGREQGKLVKEMLGGKGNIILGMGTLGTAPQVLRTKGLKDYLAENAPDIKVVMEVSTDWDNDKTIAFVQNALTKYAPGEIDGIVTQGPYDCLSALQAVQGAKRDELVGKLIAFDYPKEVQTAIEEGKLYGTVCQDPVIEGQDSVQMAYYYLTGEKDKVKELQWIPIPTVTKDTIIPATWGNE